MNWKGAHGPDELHVCGICPGTALERLRIAIEDVVAGHGYAVCCMGWSGGELSLSRNGRASLDDPSARHVDASAYNGILLTDGSPLRCCAYDGNVWYCWSPET